MCTLYSSKRVRAHERVREKSELGLDMRTVIVGKVSGNIVQTQVGGVIKSMDESEQPKSNVPLDYEIDTFVHI